MDSGYWTSCGIFAQNSAVVSPPLPPAATSPVKVSILILGFKTKSWKLNLWYWSGRRWGIQGRGGVEKWRHSPGNSSPSAWLLNYSITDKDMGCFISSHRKARGGGISVTTGIITKVSAIAVHWWRLWGEGHWPRLISNLHTHNTIWYSSDWNAVRCSLPHPNWRSIKSNPSNL